MRAADRTAGQEGALDLARLAFDDIGPERIYHYYSATTGLRAVLVIDTVRFGISAGGVRMAPDLSLAEMARLARAMSYKFAMLELPCGGAKAGIWFDPCDPGRRVVMHAFVEAIRPLVEARAYLAGADMGTYAADFVGLHPEGGGTPSLAQQDFEGMSLEEQLTGCGVVAATHAACAVLGLPLAGARVAIEGFGKVGAGAAKYFARAGARVVAVSTVRGALYQPDGVDVARLLALRASHGDGALEELAAPHPLLPRDALFPLPVDILVPGARPDAIDDRNVDAIEARLIVPAANIPYAPGTAERLHARGVVPLPDFVTNAGGVLAGLVEMQGGTANDAFTTVRARVAENVRRVLRAARDQGCSAYAAALTIARQRLGATG